MDEIRSKLCTNNISLLSELEQKIEVVFERSDEDDWGAQLTNGNKTGIVYYPDKFSDARVAHELLHLKIGLIMGHNGNLAIQANLYPPYLTQIFTDEVLEHFLNSYEHMKIIDEYRLMGFSDADFFNEDANQDQRISLFKSIKEGGFYTNGYYNIKDLFFYITSTIALLSYPLDANKWKKDLKTLNRACKPLYKIIEEYWKTILLIPINDVGKTRLNLEHEKFVKNLSRWIKSIKIRS